MQAIGNSAVNEYVMKLQLAKEFPDKDVKILKDSTKLTPRLISSDMLPHLAEFLRLTLQLIEI